MSDLFDLSNFDKYKEDNCREVKKAEGGLPIALWESYSSFANSNGGVIILGVGERQDGTWYTTGLKNADKLKRNFWKFNSHPRFPFCKRVSHFESDLQILYPTFHFCNDFPVFFLAFMI